MPFGSTSSLTASDFNNMFRGVHRDNTDNSHTGDTTETDLATFTLTANTLTGTGGLRIIAAGGTAGTAGTKTIRLDFGTTTMGTITIAAASTNSWLFDWWVFNTATNAQRFVGVGYDGTAIDVLGRTSSSEDTTANVIVKVTGQLANAGDTITQSIYDLFVFQIA